METQLVISTMSEKYGHVSSLGCRASLFIFINTASHHFSLSYYAFVFVTRFVKGSGMVVSGDRGREEKHGHLLSLLNSDPARRLSKSPLLQTFLSTPRCIRFVIFYVNTF